MTRFRDVQQAIIMATVWVDDDKTKSDYNIKKKTWNCVCVVKPNDKTSDTNDDVTTKTNTVHMKRDTWQVNVHVVFLLVRVVVIFTHCTPHRVAQVVRVFALISSMHEVSVTLRLWALHSIQLPLLFILLQSRAVPGALQLPRGYVVTVCTPRTRRWGLRTNPTPAQCKRLVPIFQCKYCAPHRNCWPHNNLLEISGDVLVPPRCVCELILSTGTSPLRVRIKCKQSTVWVNTMNFSYINAPSGAQKHALKNTLLRQVCVCVSEKLSSNGSVSGDHIFVMSATCSVLSCFAVSDCHSLLTAIRVACCSDAFWLKAKKSVCTHEMSLVCCVTKKGVSLRLSL